MSIKKSLRITYVIFALIPLVMMLFLSNRTMSNTYKDNMKKEIEQQVALYQKQLRILIDATDSDFSSAIKSMHQILSSILFLDDKRHAQILSPFEVIYSTSADTVDSLISTTKLYRLYQDYASKTIPYSGSFYSDDQSSQSIYGYAFLTESGPLLLISEQLRYVPDWSYMIRYLIYYVILLIPSTLFVLNYYEKHYLNPIYEIRRVMRTAASGDLNVTSTIKAKNELGDLSRSLNKMLHIIKGNYDELTAMHDRILENEDALQNNYAKIEYLAYHDVLTELPNRLSFLEFSNAILSQSKVSSDHHAFFFIDLDNFKMINDTLGHDYGDMLLKQTATRLLSLISEKDCVARAGGDEFMIMLSGIDFSSAILFADQIIEAFKLPFHLDNETAYVSMSIGIAIYPENGLDSTSLTKNADIAMYNSKENGKNKFTIFDHQMEEQLNRKNVITEVLRHAISNKEIYLLYQPQVNLATEKIVAFEALMRIYNPKLGLISPKEFIPIAEETGLINELGTWALRQACQFNKSLLDSGLGPCTVAVNISPVQINRFDFYDGLSEILTETKLPPYYLELELTESALVSSIAGTATIIRNLKSIGVKAALDDFGTGYSSLSYLAKMNIHTLKIDKSFIDNICAGEKDLSMIHTIIRLAHHLEIQVVAEGAEYPEQLALLREKKCDLVQGFVYSRPISCDDLIALLKNGLSN